MLISPTMQDPNDLRVIGERLADSDRWAPYVDGLNGLERSWCAILLENQLAHMLYQGKRPEDFMETTKVLQVGNFDKYAFPIVRAVYPNLVANELVSVQPMAGPVSLVFYLDFLLGTTKGNLTAGTAAFDARSGPINSEYYSGRTIPEEVVTVASVSAGNIDYTLAKAPVKPGTVRVTTIDGSAVTRVYADNGAGGFIQISGTASAVNTGDLNYQTGLITDLDIVAAIVSATATYECDFEASEANVMQMDMQLTSSPVQAEVRKLRARWSLEAAQNLNALHGLDAEAELVSVISEWIKYEQDRQVINELYYNAGAGNVQWDKNIPPGISWTEHKLSLVDAFIQGSNLVFNATKRGMTNWVVMGLNVANVVESLPTFVPTAGAMNTQSNTGVVKMGTLSGRWTCFKDPFFPSSKWVSGFKGNSFLDAGYVFAPYIPLYSTPTVILDDFQGRKGVGTQYGTKFVNSLFYSTGEIVNV